MMSLSNNPVMTASVIVPVYNGEKHLDATLTALLNQSCSFNYEILVVDNNSTDQTAVIVKNYETKHPDRVRYILEPQKGVCAARNRGVKESRSGICCFLDDDCVAEASWLTELVETIQKNQAEAVLGKVILATPIPANIWFPRDFINTRLAQIDYGPHVQELTNQDMVTANMACRKSVFEKYGGFDSNPAFHLCEDTEFSVRLMRAGVKRFYNPNAIVYHHFDVGRLSEDSFLKQSFAWGRANIYFEPSGMHPLKHTIFCLMKLFGAIGKSFWYQLLGDRVKAFLWRCQIFGHWGRCVQIMKFSKKK